MPFNEFRRRFDILVIEKGDRNQDPVLDEKQVFVAFSSGVSW